MLSDLGLDNEVVGITKFCVHPEHWRQTKTIVGGTKNVDHRLVDSLKLDFIIANKEENTKEDVELLMKKFKVCLTDIKTVDDCYESINTIANLTGTSGQSIINNIKTSFASLPSFEIKRALYLIWKKPWMAAGGDTFVNEMMKVCGFENVVKEHRYPTLTKESMQHLNPQVVLLSSEPYPFKDQHIDELKKLLPEAKVMLVDGEMFSWYGSRMMLMAEYFRELRATAF